MSDRPAVAVLGGTFNPIHYGHLRSAVELLEQLPLAELRLMPCAEPPHREAPQISAEHRARMVELAIAEEAQLLCDRRELARPGPSYTIDSLRELRREMGSDTPLCLILGTDALLKLPSWKRWQELLDYSHIVVMARPGWSLDEATELADWLAPRWAASARSLAEAPAGQVLSLALRPLAVSSTEIRSLLREGSSVRYLLPDAVVDYIERNDLYR